MNKTKPPVIECGSGWASLYQPLIERCLAEGVEITQIKEKFGELRFYINNGTPELMAAIESAKKRSLKMCEICGAPGKIGSYHGWLKTFCDEHSSKWHDRHP